MVEENGSIKQTNLIKLSRIEYSSAMKEQLEMLNKKDKNTFLNL